MTKQTYIRRLVYNIGKQSGNLYAKSEGITINIKIKGIITLSEVVSKASH